MADEIKRITGVKAEFVPSRARMFDVRIDGKSVWRRSRPGIYPTAETIAEIFEPFSDRSSGE